MGQTSSRFRTSTHAGVRFAEVALRFMAMSTYPDDVVIVANAAISREKLKYLALTKSFRRIH